MNVQALHASRVLMGDSLGFHIIFVMFGLTLPVLVVWFEWWAHHKKDKKMMDVAHLWSKIMALLVITGVISGTVIALQMSLVWPGILKFGGQVIGLPFMFETYAFLIEAVFLALYIATWNNPKIPRLLHIIFGVFVIFGSTLSAYAITSINAWMNLPAGFDFVNGKIQNIDVWQALFSRTTLIEFFHSMPAYYLAASLSIAGIYGFKLLRSRNKERLNAKHKTDWLIIQRLVIFATAALVMLVITADLSGKYLAKYEPSKLAAIELTDKTGSHLPFILGGVPNSDGKISGPYFIIPNALSILVGSSSNTVVKGINEFPVNQRPPSFVRALFNIKLTLIGIMVAGLAVYFVIRKWRSKLLANTGILLPLSIGSFIGVVIVELGWMLTEIGRQPWAVRGFVTTLQAVTKTHNITTFGYIFPLAYVALFAVTILGIRKIVRDTKVQPKGAK